jgi:hypothetical protein
MEISTLALFESFIDDESKQLQGNFMQLRVRLVEICLDFEI